MNKKLFMSDTVSLRSIAIGTNGDPRMVGRLLSAAGANEVTGPWYDLIALAAPSADGRYQVTLPAHHARRFYRTKRTTY